MGNIKRMPKLAIDEVLLLVDTYFQMKEISSSAIRKDMIQELSDNMRKLPFNPEFKSDPAYRSVSGMNMCLSNVASLERKSLMHSSKMQRKVFDYYKEQTDKLHKLSMSIISVSNYEFPILNEYSDNIEGMILPSYCRFIEHNNSTVRSLKKELYSYHKTVCNVCKDDLFPKYGENTLDIMELHLNRLLSDFYISDKITPSDLVLVCPNCHRMAHLQPENYTLGFMSEIKGELNVQL